MSSEAAKNPTEGSGSWHVIERDSLNLVSGFGPMTSTNRHVRDQGKCPWGRPACVVVWGGTVSYRPLPDWELLMSFTYQGRQPSKRSVKDDIKHNCRNRSY